MKELITKTDKVLIDILRQLEEILLEHFNNSITIKELLCEYSTYSYYNGVFTFSHKNKLIKHRDMYVLTDVENAKEISFINLESSHSGRLISGVCDSSDLFKLLPTRDKVIQNILNSL